MSTDGSSTIDSIADLLHTVQRIGDYAHQRQSEFRFVDRDSKPDGSVITEIDHEVEEKLRKYLQEHHPGAGILGEEGNNGYNANQRYTFAVDPIDGTDAFSQGMPGWSVSVGLLDNNLQPIAGIVYAPAWDSLFFADIDGSVTHNAIPLKAPSEPMELTRQTNIMVDSRIHTSFNLRAFGGKVRSIGSTALQACLHLEYGGVLGSVAREVRVWDIAGADAINRALGCAPEYRNGGPVTYSNLMDGSRAPDHILFASPRNLPTLRKILKPWDEKT